MDIWTAIENHNVQLLVEILHEESSVVNIGFSTRSLFKKTEFDKPIHLATRKGFTKIVLILIQYGADVNIINHNGETALHIAAANDFKDLLSV